MKLASVIIGGRPTWGLVEGQEFADLGAVCGANCPDLRTALRLGLPSLVAHAAPLAVRHPLSAITWAPVIPNPDKILCVGLNYDEHRRETGRSEVQHPTIFGRFANSQTGHLVPVAQPKVSTEVDYEGELALIIGKPGRYITPADAMDHVAGYAVYNDISIRDYQRHSHQFTPGKNFPGTGAFGPWMITPDAMGPIGAQTLQTRLNGQVMQQARLDQMLFDIPTIIAYCSQFTELQIGDVIATGTPGGVGAKRQPPVWMQPGDLVEVEIDGLGCLQNRIIAEM
jgi:2-keto-4-pentenoate hydratase/2-oxohepta-3-ene-1,7-dioic acid hydratase in catechol pathway